MSELPFPLRQALREQAAHDDARANDDAIGRLVAGGVRRVARRKRRRRALGVAGALGAVAVAVFAIAWRGRALRVEANLDGGALRFASGAVFQALEARADVVEASLRDGSSVRAMPGASLRVRVNDGSHLTSTLASGAARFSVRPGGPRRWTVDCEGVLIEVIGTVFTVAREDDAVRVSVEHGRVRVDGQRFGAPVRVLTDGEVWRVPFATPPVASVASVLPSASAPPAATPSAVVVAATSARSGEPRRPARESAAWRALARDGDFRGAYESLGAEGLASAARASSPDDLLALADVARLSGHPSEAVAPLERVISDHGRTASAPLAAITLARVELAGMHRPDRAAAALRRALSLGVPSALEEDARAGLVEALSAAHDRAGARAAADEYLSRFPQGRRAAAVRRWGEVL